MHPEQPYRDMSLPVDDRVADLLGRADEAVEFAGRTGADQARLMVESEPVVRTRTALAFPLP